MLAPTDMDVEFALAASPADASSLDATRILLQVVGHQAGVKAAGGIRTPEQAAEYVALADSTLGVKATPRTFRIGASSLLDELLARA